MDIPLDPWHLWIIVGICLFIGEVFLPGFILASIGVGCLAGGITQWVSGDTAYALGAFIVWAGASLVLIRPYLSKVLGPEEASRFGVDGMIGDVIQITDANDIGGHLKARYRDTLWTLHCEEELFEGDKAQIISVDGGVLVVTPVRED